ncbi:dsDNA nuclease domain-containing protein [Luteimonas sp. A537]
MANISNAASSRPELHEVAPREVKGRDVIARFEGQFRSAALACLKILEGKGTDRVFCDYHDDFVERELVNGEKTYHFVQVKTKKKKSYQWSRNELLGIPKNLPKVAANVHGPGGVAAPSQDESKKLSGSFIGKLLIHTAHFKDACASVTFQTNVHFDGDVEKIELALMSAQFDERTLRYLADNYSVICGPTDATLMPEIENRLAKLRFSGGNAFLHPHDHDFENKAKAALYQFCEIDVSHAEGLELAVKLLGLVQKRSSAETLHTMSVAELELTVSVGLDELLDLLPISPGAYRTFLANGDSSALKNASILQRKLGPLDASGVLVETASKWKVDWETWSRTARHTYEVEWVLLQAKLNKIYGHWAGGELAFFDIHKEVSKLLASLDHTPLKGLLTVNLLLGAVMSELVRSEAR